MQNKVFCEDFGNLHRDKKYVSRLIFAYIAVVITTRKQLLNINRYAGQMEKVAPKIAVWLHSQMAKNGIIVSSYLSVSQSVCYSLFHQNYNSDPRLASFERLMYNI